MRTKTVRARCVCVSFLLAIGFLFADCSLFSDNPNVNKTRGSNPNINVEYPIEKLNSSFAKAAFLTAKAVSDYIEVMGITPENSGDVRSALQSTTEEIDLYDLELYMRGRSSGLKMLWAK